MSKDDWLDVDPRTHGVYWYNVAMSLDKKLDGLNLDKINTLDWLDMNEDEYKDYWYKVAMSLKRQVIELKEENENLIKELSKLQ